MARAMRASGDLKPKAMRVMRRILVFMVIWRRALGGVCLWAVPVGDMSLTGWRQGRGGRVASRSSPRMATRRVRRAWLSLRRVWISVRRVARCSSREAGAARWIGGDRGAC